MMADCRGRIEFIRRRVHKKELLVQLAEECMELGQAALKLRRTQDGENPTPMTEEQAMECFVEELNDLYLCVNLVGDVLNGADSDMTEQNLTDAQEKKVIRWADRLGYME